MKQIQQKQDSYNSFILQQFSSVDIIFFGTFVNFVPIFNPVFDGNIEELISTNAQLQESLDLSIKSITISGSRIIS